MSVSQLSQSNMHCVRASKIFDWLVHCSTIRKEIPVCSHKIVDTIKEEICDIFYLNPATQSTLMLWENSSSISVTGTVLISNHSVIERERDLYVYINEEYVFSLSNGQSRSITVEQIQSLSIAVPSGDSCEGSFYLALNQKPLSLALTGVEEDRDLNINLNDIEYFFTDSCGKEIKQCTEGNGICEVDVNVGSTDNCLLSNGEKAKLQEIVIRKKGYVCIKITNNCFIGPIPFINKESFWMCVPPRTEVTCSITKMFCNVDLIPSNDEKICYFVDLTIGIKQSIEVTGKTNVTLLGKSASTREGNIHKSFVEN